MTEYEQLSAVVSAVLSFSSNIQITQADCQIVAHSFERSETLRPHWDLAVQTACKLCPWLTDDDASESDWSMNLFTVDGLWSFPA
jgi:hypothetical protein